VTALAGDDDPGRAAAALAAGGPLVVVKDGERGAVATHPSGAAVSVAGRARTPVDTTGAGDTFNAAFLDSWLDGAELTESLARAVLAGALAVSAVGGTAGQPTRNDLITAGAT
jgi:ribokinase